MSTKLQEKDSVSYQVKRNLPYKINRRLLLLEYVNAPSSENMPLANKTELMQVRSILNRGIVISASLTAFLSIMALSGIFEESISVPLIAVSSSILLALGIERRKKRA